MIANKDADLIKTIKKAKKCCKPEYVELSVTENGEYAPDEGKAYNKVNVNVAGGGGGNTPIKEWLYNTFPILKSNDILVPDILVGVDIEDNDVICETFEDVLEFIHTYIPSPQPDNTSYEPQFLSLWREEVELFSSGVQSIGYSSQIGAESFADWVLNIAQSENCVWEDYETNGTVYYALALRDGPVSSY